MKGRTIIGTGNVSPAAKLREQNVKNGLPARLSEAQLTQLLEVHYWSDVVANIWRERAGPQRVRSLKYMFKHNIETASTKNVINAILGTERKEWPGFKFDEGSIHFRALLGTPHRNGIYRMLFQHKDWFGGRRVKQIRIFTDSPMGKPLDHLLFELTD